MNASPPQGPPHDAIRLSYRYRFNPQVLLLVVAGLLAWPAIVGAVVATIHVLWSDSFRVVDYTMEEAHANGDAPYVSGRRADNGAAVNVAARRDGPTYVVGDETFAAGKTIGMWVSDAAPDIVISGRRTNAVPVASMPERPGLLAVVANLAWIFAVIAVALRVMRWIVVRRSAPMAP